MKEELSWACAIMPGESLLKFHQELDALLLSKYGVPIDKFDKVFQPHISLFTSGDRDDTWICITC